MAMAMAQDHSLTYRLNNRIAGKPLCQTTCQPLKKHEGVGA